MILYFDTSALAKYFHHESGSDGVTKLVEGRDNIIWISELTITEFLSLCHRKFRLGEITLTDLQKVITIFEETTETWNIEPFSTLQSQEANKIIKQYGKTAGIRSLDALQMAAFNLLKEDNWEFVVADKQLNNVAISTGIKTILIQ